MGSAATDKRVGKRVTIRVLRSAAARFSVQVRAGARRLSCVRLHVLAAPLAALLVASAVPAYAQSGAEGDLTGLALEDLLNVKV